MSEDLNKPKIGYHTPIIKKSFQKSIETCHKKSNINDVRNSERVKSYTDFHKVNTA